MTHRDIECSLKVKIFLTVVATTVDCCVLYDSSSDSWLCRNAPARTTQVTSCLVMTCDMIRAGNPAQRALSPPIQASSRHASILGTAGSAILEPVLADTAAARASGIRRFCGVCASTQQGLMPKGERLSAFSALD